ncbi:phenylethanolamine N-methyltransferase [Danio aesculapii]|uniref:phenylethanolamine N-methyltransferase n=1 Tax=Danio aesculapii TaxID=1142201 RepID=UPI0024BF292A|nr:phenylethanolamine N-methyltransferase [Danio aesculapii]
MEKDRERQKMKLEKIKMVTCMESCYQGFDPAAYLHYNYTPPRADFERRSSIVPWKLSCLHRAFTEDDIRGGILVDVGSGPTLYQVMSGCERFDHVILSDYLEVNRKELQSWLQEGKSMIDWTAYFKYVCELEGRSSSAWVEKATRLRSVVSDVLPLDVLQSCPLLPGLLPPSGADCLVSSFCLESVTHDLLSFTHALRNISSLLKKGGYLFLIGALGESFYLGAPGLYIPVVPLNESQVCASLKDSGYELLQLCIYHMPPEMKVGVDDVTGVFFVKAKKA